MSVWCVTFLLSGFPRRPHGRPVARSDFVTSFVLESIPADPQSLGAGEIGYITRSGGVITGTTSPAVDVLPLGRLIVEGSVYALARAVDIRPGSTVDVLPTGVITGSAVAIDLTADTSGPYVITNHGMISARWTAISWNSASSFVAFAPTIVNTGTITGADGTAMFLRQSAGLSTVRNSGAAAVRRWRPRAPI
jgi:hypothetical protein